MLPNKTHSIIIMETQKAAKDLSNQLRILRNLKKSMVRWGGHSKGGVGVEKSHSSELRLTMNLTKLVSIEGFDAGSIDFHATVDHTLALKIGQTGRLVIEVRLAPVCLAGQLVIEVRLAPVCLKVAAIKTKICAVFALLSAAVAAAVEEDHGLMRAVG